VLSPVKEHLTQPRAPATGGAELRTRPVMVPRAQLGPKTSDTLGGSDRRRPDGSPTASTPLAAGRHGKIPRFMCRAQGPLGELDGPAARLKGRVWSTTFSVRGNTSRRALGADGRRCRRAEEEKLVGWPRRSRRAGGWLVEVVEVGVVASGVSTSVSGRAAGAAAMPSGFPLYVAAPGTTVRSSTTAHDLTRPPHGRPVGRHAAQRGLGQRDEVGGRRQNLSGVRGPPGAIVRARVLNLVEDEHDGGRSAVICRTASR